MASLPEVAESNAPTTARNFKSLVTKATSKIVSMTNKLRLLGLISNVSLRTLTHLKYYSKEDDYVPGAYSPDSRSDHEKILAEQQAQLENLNKKLREQYQQGGGEKYPKYSPK